MDEAPAIDTSGAVPIPNSGGQVRRGWLWRDLTPFAQGYTAGLLLDVYESLDMATKDGMELTGSKIAFTDLAPATLATILRDCEAWHLGAIAEVSDPARGEWFWKHRQNGFYPKTFPPLHLTTADDGLIYFRSAENG